MNGRPQTQSKPEQNRASGWRWAFGLAAAAALALMLTWLWLGATGFATARLREAVARDEVIELKKFTAFEWDKVHIFAPYAPPEQIKSDVGQEVRFPHSRSEGHCLLVFLAGSSVIRSIEIQRNHADFSELHRAGGYRPEEAVFVVKRTPDGWRKLQLQRQVESSPR
jgi:hypothetical protein